MFEGLAGPQIDIYNKLVLEWHFRVEEGLEEMKSNIR